MRLFPLCARYTLSIPWLVYVSSAGESNLCMTICDFWINCYWHHFCAERHFPPWVHVLFISKLIEILHWVLECSSLLLRVVAKSFYLIHKKLNLSEFGCFNKYYKIEEFSAIRGTENIKKKYWRKIIEKNGI